MCVCLQSMLTVMGSLFCKIPANSLDEETPILPPWTLLPPKIAICFVLCFRVAAGICWYIGTKTDWSGTKYCSKNPILEWTCTAGGGGPQRNCNTVSHENRIPSDITSEYRIFFRMDVGILIYWFREQQDDLESQNALWDISRHLSSHLVLEVPFFLEHDVRHVFFVSSQEATQPIGSPACIDSCFDVISPFRMAQPPIRAQEFSGCT